MGVVRRYDPTTVKQLRCCFLLFSYTRQKRTIPFALFPRGFSSRKHRRPEEVKMLKFPTLLFLFHKIGNPGPGRFPPDLEEHFSTTVQLRQGCQIHNGPAAVIAGSGAFHIGRQTLNY